MSLPMFHRPLPATPPVEPTPHTLTPGSARPLPAMSTESAQCPPLPAKPRAQLSTAGKISQPTFEVPVSPRVLNGTTHELPSPGNLETCSQSSSSSALHPVTLAALSRQRKSAVHTRHPYEYWATNQQDVTNMRMLSQYPWFHGMVSRANASQLVVNGGEGQYLVRRSKSGEGDFVLTFNYHSRAKHLRMTVDNNGCNIQHLWFDSVPSMLDYFKTNSIPLESFWLNDDVKLTNYIHRQASEAFRTTTILNVDQLNQMSPRRSRSLHLGMSRSVTSGSSHPSTGSIEQRGSSSSSASTNSLPHAQSSGNGWRKIFRWFRWQRSQRSSSAGNVGRIQRSSSHNAGSVQGTGRGGVVSAGGGGSSRPSNLYV